MAKTNLRPKSAVRKIQITRNETSGERNRRDWFCFNALQDNLKTIRAVADVLNYAGEVCQGEGERLTIIVAGLGEALLIAHERIAAQAEEVQS